MRQWHNLMREVLAYGETRSDRTGVGTKSLFGLYAQFDNTLRSFPAVTTKKLAVKQCFGEMASFIQGHTNLEQFHANGCTIWDANAGAKYWTPSKPGDLGRIYGAVWRQMGGIDQLAELVDGLKKSPTSRRHLVTAWSPGEPACLPPCHTHFQCYVSEGKYLDLQVYMRSVDLFLGLPFDIAGYALLQRLIAKEVNLESRRLLFSFGDAHIYLNHLEAVQTVLARMPYAPPKLVLADDASLFTFTPEQARLLDYQHHAAVKAPMAV